MVAQVIEFEGVSLRRKALRSTRQKPTLTARPAPSHQFEFWTGASGQPYVHTIYTLLWCPEIPAANYVLVKRTADGRRQALRFGCAESDAPSLNLAAVRHLGATLGANEVHVHLLADTADQRHAVEADLNAGAATCSLPRSAHC